MTILDLVAELNRVLPGMVPDAATAPTTGGWEILKQVLQILSFVVGGLGIFLLGMKNMSEGLQAIAGNSLRRLIGAVTNHRLMAASVGTLVTCVVQSSSVTTVMVVGFVNSGLMALNQAVGVIMGANIGTTITPWILALRIDKYGLPILGLSAFVYLFSRRDRWRFTAMAIMGIGMIFFGLLLMKDGVKIIGGIPEFDKAFSYFAATSYFGVLKCAAVGCLLTVLVQSSSATLGITIALATGGVIEFPTAAALVLGENIGTTITALLASIGTTTNAKRAAYFHLIFNVLGVLWITALFQPYIVLVQSAREVLGRAIPFFAGEDLTASIALVHSGFNITNTLLFLPFVPLITRLLQRFVPDKPHKEKPHLTNLDIRMLETPTIAVEQSRTEVLRMSEGVLKMMKWLEEFREGGAQDEKIAGQIFHREEVLDSIQHEVMVFMTSLLSGNIPHSVSEEGRQQVRTADELESTSDVIISVLKAHLRVRKAGLDFSPEQLNRLAELHESTSAYIRLVTEGYEQRFAEVVAKAHTRGNAINHQIRALRAWHMEQLSESKIEPLVSMSFTTILQSYRQIKDHALNIAEAVAGEK